jgi:hypothetical protein
MRGTMTLVNIGKRFVSLLSSFARISMFKHFCDAELFFSCEVSEKYFTKNFHFGPNRWVP